MRPVWPFQVAGVGLGEGEVEVEVGEAMFEDFEFVFEDDVLFGFGGVGEVDGAGPGFVGEVADDGNEGRDADAAGDEDEAGGF